jgi:FG-GAP-like repeat
LGNGSGSFSTATNSSVGDSPISVAVGDFNGDGKQDIATANLDSDNVSLLLGIANEINVKGNSVDVADGDITPL